MGLWVQSLENIPSGAQRGYYIYLLDYGWSEPLSDAIMSNYEKMASIAAKNDAVVIRGTDRVHFEDEVLSWHNINGENAEDLLPAILITNRNPHKFRERSVGGHFKIEGDLRMILIPLRKICSTTTEVVALIKRIFNDIAEKKTLQDFRIEKEVKKDNHHSFADSVTLQPDYNGAGITYKDMVNFIGKGHKISTRSLAIEKVIYPIHFEDRSGGEFERLAFAFVHKIRDWDSIKWLGQTGNDDGRDIWGIYKGRSFCYQCANYRQLTLKKATTDIDKLVQEKFIPDSLVLICGGRATANIRAKINQYAKLAEIKDTEIWSGVEFEERLRKHTPELLKRFVEGDIFPEIEQEHNSVNDSEIVSTLIECFDRPAFTTSFHSESNIPDFEKAMTDTIEALNTGMHRLRDGTLIRKIASRHQIKDPGIKDQFAAVTQLTIKLREAFNVLKRSGEIGPCGCGNKDCPTWFLSDKACIEMDHIRRHIFRKLKEIAPHSNLRIF